VAACTDARAAGAGGRPTAILATTVKGRGVSFLEDRFEWHARVATADEVAAAAIELAPADVAESADSADVAGSVSAAP
jgi:transketolase